MYCIMLLFEIKCCEEKRCAPVVHPSHTSQKQSRELVPLSHLPMWNLQAAALHDAAYRGRAVDMLFSVYGKPNQEEDC